MAPKDELNLYRQKLQLLKELPVNETPKTRHYGYTYGPELCMSCSLSGMPYSPAWASRLYTVRLKTKLFTVLVREPSPSDTVCYPAKLMHGHIKWLLQQGITNIFYPCMTYNIDEQGTENCYNCPVVAYYPEVLHANIRDLNKPEIHFFL